MSNEYNSILLGKLYKEKNENKLIDILDDIGKTGNPIFLYPIFETYKENKDKSISHYFLDTLGKIKSDGVIPIVLEIASFKDIKLVDIMYILNILENNKAYNEEGTEIAIKALDLFLLGKEEDADEYNLYDITAYLKNTNSLKQIEEKLEGIIQSTKFNSKVLQFALEKWIEIDPKENLETIIDIFDDLDSEKQILLAKILIHWKGKKTNKLIALIEEKGNLEAKKIIEQHKEKIKNNKKITKEQEKSQDIYNTNLIEKISILRNNINKNSSLKDNIGFDIFPQDETLFLQLKAPKDDATLMKYCAYMRDFIQNLNENFKKHNLSGEEIKKLMPSTQKDDFNKSINSFFLFFSKINIKINQDVFGFRTLVTIVGLIAAHPKEKTKLIKILKKESLLPLYKEENWAMIHQSLLQKYTNGLESLFEVLK